MVIFTALRRGGSWELAQEAAQNVFTSLSRNAARLAGVKTIPPGFPVRRCWKPPPCSAAKPITNLP